MLRKPHPLRRAGTPRKPLLEGQAGRGKFDSVARKREARAALKLRATHPGITRGKCYPSADNKLLPITWAVQRKVTQGPLKIVALLAYP
jgi:hypothetical protein